MLRRFTSVLFRDDAEEELSCRPGAEEEEAEEEEDWILVDFLDTSKCSAPVGPGEEEEEEEDLVMIPSPMASPPLRYASCSSLNSTADTDADRGGEEEEEEEDGEGGGFLCVQPPSLEESWFVTPPPCFTGCSSLPVAVETSPLENLLIEHPSMSVYARHRPRPLLPGATPTANASSPRKKKGRRHRPAGGTVSPGLFQHIQQQSGAQPLCPNALSCQPLSPNTVSRQGLSPNALSRQPLSPNALSRQGLSPNALSRLGLSPNALSRQVLSPNALSRQGLSPNTVSRQGLSPNTVSRQLLSPNALSRQLLSPNALRRLNLRRQRAAKQGRTCPLVLHQPRHLNC